MIHKMPPSIGAPPPTGKSPEPGPPPGLGGSSGKTDDETRTKNITISNVAGIFFISLFINIGIQFNMTKHQTIRTRKSYRP